MNSATIRNITLFIILILFQLMIGRNLVIMGTAFCFVYLLFLLVLPIETKTVPLLVLGFVVGIIVDMIYNTGGMHAAASVLIMMIRRWWLNSITPQGGFDAGAYPGLAIGGFSWFIGYAFPLIFVHHTAVFFLESYGFSFFWSTLNKAFFSSIFTLVLSVVFLVLGTRSNN